MQIVIDIPEEVYEKAKVTINEMCDSVWLGIKQGTPLPKGHGRLIDADDLHSEFADGTEGYDFAHWTRYDVIGVIDDTPTVVEANKGD